MLVPSRAKAWIIMHSGYSDSGFLVIISELLANGEI